MWLLCWQWGAPDAAGLRAFCASKFGWSDTQTNQVLDPVLRAAADPTAQSKLDA